MVLRSYTTTDTPPEVMIQLMSVVLPIDTTHSRGVKVFLDPLILTFVQLVPEVGASIDGYLERASGSTDHEVRHDRHMHVGEVALIGVLRVVLRCLDPAAFPVIQLHQHPGIALHVIPECHPAAVAEVGLLIDDGTKGDRGETDSTGRPDEQPSPFLCA